MNCAFDKEKLTGYYDGELVAAEKAEVERHIASCSECLRELGELKSAAILVKELPRLRAPRSIAEGVSREIQAAGKVHSFAKFRRTLLWAASAAAGLLVVLNVVYFIGKTEMGKTEGEPATAAAPSPAVSMGRAQPQRERESDLKHETGKDPSAASRPAPAEGQKDRGVRLEERKNTFAAEDGKKLEQTEAPKPDAAARDKATTGTLAKSEEKPRAATEPVPAPPAPEKPKPAAASPPPPPAPAPTARPAEAPAEKKKEADAFAGGAKSDELKAKKTFAPEPAAEAGPTHLTLASTQMTKSRPQLEDTLRRMGALPAVPPAAMMKGARSATREESVYQVELTDAQIARLRAELEKPGTTVLVAGRPEDPVLSHFRRGGVYEARKENPAVAGAAPAKKAASDPKQPEGKAESKDAKENEEAPAGKSLAEGAAEKSAEPRRKVVVHIMEVQSIPTQPAGDPVKK